LDYSNDFEILDNITISTKDIKKCCNNFEILETEYGTCCKSCGFITDHTRYDKHSYNAIDKQQEPIAYSSINHLKDKLDMIFGNKFIIFLIPDNDLYECKTLDELKVYLKKRKLNKYINHASYIAKTYIKHIEIPILPYNIYKEIINDFKYFQIKFNMTRLQHRRTNNLKFDYIIYRLLLDKYNIDVSGLIRKVSDNKAELYNSLFNFINNWT